MGPLRHDWVFLAAVLAIGAPCLAISRYYNEHYGRLTPVDARSRSAPPSARAVAVALMLGASLLLRSRASWSLDLPVNPIAVAFGAAHARLVRRSASASRRTTSIIWGALLVAGALPVWNGADPSNIGLAARGRGASIVSGVFDHRLFVRTFGPPTPSTSRTAMSQPEEELVLDRLIHEPGRLAILTVLSSVSDADFVFLLRATGLTKGNLSSHLTKLEDAGLVAIEKRFVRKKPNTNVALTRGRAGSASPATGSSSSA